MMKWLRELILKWLNDYAKKPTSMPKPLPPVTEPDPASPGTATTSEPIDLAAVKWYGKSAAKAKLVPAPALRNVRITGDNIRCEFDDMPDSWPITTASNGKKLQGWYHLFYERDGKVCGGEFDKVTHPGQPVKTLENIAVGRHGHAMPAKGTKCWAMWTNNDMTERSAVVEVGWK